MRDELLLLITLLIGAATSSALTEISSLYLAVDNVLIKQAFKTAGVTVSTQIRCSVKVCTGIQHCAFAFKRQSGQCVGVNADSHLLSVLARTGLLFKASSESGWTTYVSKGLDVTMDGPPALWLLDNVSKGRNLGVKGSVLDMTETGLSWTSTGPRGSASDRKYATMTSSNRAAVQLLQGGNYLLNLTQPFTIAVWVRTDDVVIAMPIIEGRVSGSEKMPFHFWFYDDKRQSQLYTRLGHSRNHRRDHTVINATGRLDWRHIGFTYLGGTQMKFYLNGNEWKIDASKGLNNNPGVEQPDLFQIGHRLNGADIVQFQGSMACLSFFERVLNAEDMRRWMQACP